ncbi:MAG: BlaI/MecI/CopY family transcriptional regulator [Microscillaceae bacterium]|jgi:predicted transcriptional regulator|nr:BlaI/MecI/CopY family transcriptional regulator [Microscillaceae bacterium]
MNTPKELKELTKAEEEVMQVLWNLQKAFIKDMLPHLPPIEKTGKSPSYTTVATVLKVLEIKGFVYHEEVGNVYQFLPKVSKETYQEFLMSKVMRGYFNGSLKSLVSFFVKSEKVDMQELDEIMRMIAEKKKN